MKKVIAGIFSLVLLVSMSALENGSASPDGEATVVSNNELEVQPDGTKIYRLVVTRKPDGTTTAEF